LLNPGGDVVGFFHTIPEEAPGADLAQDEARVLAETFLTQDQGWVLANWEAVAASSEERPGGRTDHHFDWRQRDFSVGESELRLSVDVQGDRVGSYDYWLKVPEAFQRHYMEQRNRAWFFSNISYSTGFFVFGLAAFIAYLVAAWRGVISWHTGLVPAVAVAAIALLAGLNELPLQKIWYSTTEDYVLFWLEQIFNMVIGAGYTAAGVLILWAGGQRLSKRAWPRQKKILPRSEDLWGALAHSGWRGLMLGGMMAGYLVLFYLVATRLLGGWTPLDVPNTRLFATPFPFLAPLESGLVPAMNEELMYRMVGISLILAITRRPWLALLVPGFLWGVAHLGYVRDPFYMRGIELTIAGVFLLGLFFLRFGLVTTIVAHFAYNAGLTALPLLRSSEPYFVASGLMVVGAMLAPVAPGIFVGLRQWRRGRKTEKAIPQITTAMPDDLSSLQALSIDGIDWNEALNDASVTVFCLRANGEVIGAAAGRISPGSQGDIMTVFVVPEWRRKYWGSALVDALCERLRQLGAESVQVTVNSGDRISAAFWASQGWGAAVRVYNHSLTHTAKWRWRDLLQRRSRGHHT
jgi:GNAT superfamily N-acetyltransferase